MLSRVFKGPPRLTALLTDGFVRIWSTEAVYNAADPGYNKPKQLASMSYHSGTIHSVRFAGNGQYLASGADDKILCVYKLESTPPSHTASFGAYCAKRALKVRTY